MKVKDFEHFFILDIKDENIIEIRLDNRPPNIIDPTLVDHFDENPGPVTMPISDNNFKCHSRDSSVSLTQRRPGQENAVLCHPLLPIFFWFSSRYVGKRG